MTVSLTVSKANLVHFNKKHAKIIQNEECILQVNKNGNLYKFKEKFNRCFAVSIADGILWQM